MSNTSRPEDRTAISDVVVRYATGVDRREWALYATCFTDDCIFDFTSFSGGSPRVMSGAAWAANVRSLNGNFDATQHLSTNHVITFSTSGLGAGPSEATCVSEMHAQHFFERTTLDSLGHSDVEPTWCTLGGHYTNQLRRNVVGWQIFHCRLDVRWRTGNMAIFPIARAMGDRG